MKKLMAILLAGSLLIIAAGFQQSPAEASFRLNLVNYSSNRI
ncbi:hypothetical protein [Metabacillus flavus]|nr:hypothetical protein [Metabacillus flavus]